MHERTGGEGIKRTAFCRIPIAQICGGYLQTEQGDSLAVLADSIARRGLLQPVVVRRTAHGYALICGARRMAACRMLGMEEIDAALIDADDESALLCRLEEHHASRRPHFLSEAHEIAARGGMALAERSALGRGFFEDRIRALALGPQARRIAASERLSIEQCAPLHAIQNHALQEEAALLIAQRELTPGQAWRLVCGRLVGLQRMAAGEDAGRRRRADVEMHNGNDKNAAGSAAPQSGRKRRRRAQGGQREQGSIHEDGDC